MGNTTRRAAITLIAATLALTGCGGGGANSQFADEDPKGVKACDELAGVKNPDGAELTKIAEIAGLARKAEYRTISELPSSGLSDTMQDLAPGETFYLVDLSKLRAACKDAGYEFD